MAEETPRIAGRDLAALAEKILTDSLPHDKVRTHVAVWFHLYVGGPLRALREADPSAADVALTEIQVALRAIEKENRPHTEPREAGLAWSHYNRSTDVLRRERVVLQFLCDAGKSVRLANILSKANEHEPVAASAFIAHLHRLVEAGAITRVRKGLYASNEKTAQWLNSLPQSPD